MRVIDLLHLGVPRVLGTWVVDDRYLIDVGPARTVSTLLDALGDWRPEAIVLTHIHLDHAGATGALLERWPDVDVWVHPDGAPHLVDPSRLLKSAARVFGPEMERLWGLPEPVPEARIHTLGDGAETGPFRAVATPGHAGSHLVLYHAGSGTVYCGDAAGVRIGPSPYVFAPTVPPEIDVELWQRSVDRIAELRPARLAIGHFGWFDDCERHLAAMKAELSEVAARARAGGRAAYDEWVGPRLAAVGDDLREAYRLACSADLAWAGLERYVSRLPQAVDGADTGTATST